MNGRSFLAHSKERAHSKNFIGHWLNEISYNCENFNEACNLFASLMWHRNLKCFSMGLTTIIDMFRVGGSQWFRRLQ